MAEAKQVTRNLNLKIAETNLEEVREIIEGINQKLDEASVLMEQLASIELKIDVDIDWGRGKTVKKKYKLKEFGLAWLAIRLIPTMLFFYLIYITLFMLAPQ